MAVEADAGEMAEQRGELGAVGLGQRRLLQRGNVGAQMRAIAGAEQHHVDAGLVAHVTIRRVDHAGGAVLVDQKAERIVGLAEPFLDQALLRQLTQFAGDAWRIGKNAAHREHDQGADAVFARHRKHVRPRALVHHVETDHEDVPDRIVHRALERLVGEIDDRVFREPDVTDFAPRFLGEQRRRQSVARVIVHARIDGVQHEQVDVIGAEHAQRIVEARDHPRRRPPFAVPPHRRFGRHHDLVARHRFERMADHALGAVGRRRVDEIEAELDRLEHQPRRLVLAQAGFQPHPREAAGAEPGDADSQSGAAEGGVVHV